MRVVYYNPHRSIRLTNHSTVMRAQNKRQVPRFQVIHLHKVMQQDCLCLVEALRTKLLNVSRDDDLTFVCPASQTQIE